MNKYSPEIRSIFGSKLLWRHRGVSGKVRWHLNDQLLRRLWLLNAAGARLTVADAYGAPGDTLLTAIVCRHLRRRYSRLSLNFLTPNPDLVRHDPSIDSLNQPETFFSVWSWYPNLVGQRDGKTNILKETFVRLGLQNFGYEYRAKVYLTKEERVRGRELIASTSLPVLTFHIRSKVPEKNWPLERWLPVLSELRQRFHLVHLGDENEPVIDGVQRLAGRLSLRESMGVLAQARIHVGAVSFLMHAANGLDVPSVIIYGGRETPANSGYAQNINLFVAMPCGPCWIPNAEAAHCSYGLACMEKIAPADVLAAVNRTAVSMSPDEGLVN